MTKTSMLIAAAFVGGLTFATAPSMAAPFGPGTAPGASDSSIVQAQMSDRGMMRSNKMSKRQMMMRKKKMMNMKRSKKMMRSRNMM